MSESAKKIVLIGGGARSGKSTFALELARQLGTRRVFLASAQAGDDEMRERIRRHRLERGADFDTIEEPLAVPETLRRIATEADVVVLDCLTLWLSNLLLAGHAADAILARVDDLADALAPRRLHAILVTNEVGMGIVPETDLGRTFRDVAGSAHQRLGRVADEVYAAMLGVIVCLKGATGRRPHFGEPGA